MNTFSQSGQPSFERHIGPAGIAWLYAAFASLWIIGSGLFLGITVDDPVWQGRIELAKGLAFVAVTAFLLYGVLRWNQAKIDRPTMLHTALSQCNQSIVRCTSAAELFPEICRHAVQFGGMKMAWIGLIDENSGTVRLAAAEGKGIDYLHDLRISIEEGDPSGNGPTGLAIRTGEPVWCQDFLHDPRTSPWHARGREFGWRASAALPLRCGGVTVGAFNLYAGEANAFDRNASALLEEMAVDISFALDNFAREAARVKAEQQLRQAQRLTQRFLDHLPGLAYIKNAERRVIMVNEGFRAILGFDHPAEMIGKHNLELFPGPFGEKIDADDRRILATGITETLDETIGGRHFSTTKFVIDAESGEKLIAGVTLDVTERRRLGQRQQALLEINSLAADLPEEGFLRQSLEIARRLTASKMACVRFAGAPMAGLCLPAAAGADCPLCAGVAGDIAGRRDVEILDTAAPDGRMEIDTAPTRLVVPIIADDAVQMRLAVGGKAAPYDEDDVLTLRLLGNDIWRIAERRRAEAARQQQLAEMMALNRELEAAQNRLVQTEKMAAIGQLSAGIAHEINNPISFVQSNFNTLGGYIDDLLAIDAAYAGAERAMAEQSQAFDGVRRLKERCGHEFIVNDIKQLLCESKEGLERVAQIVHDLRVFSRAGEADWQWADLHLGLDSTINIARSAIKRKAEIICAYGNLPKIYCVPALLNQVFLNLIMNAAQSTLDNGRIMISTGVDGASVWIDVTDNGRGIAPEHMKRLFEPFFTTKPAGEGMGLGLSLSWGIVQRHHGQMDVLSEQGKGTTFRVMLPIDPRSAG